MNHPIQIDGQRKIAKVWQYWLWLTLWHTDGGSYKLHHVLFCQSTSWYGNIEHGSHQRLSWAHLIFWFLWGCKIPSTRRWSSWWTGNAYKTAIIGNASMYEGECPEQHYAAPQGTKHEAMTVDYINLINLEWIVSVLWLKEGSQYTVLGSALHWDNERQRYFQLFIISWAAACHSFRVSVR